VNADELVPLAEAARLVGRSPSTVRRWCRDGLVSRVAGPPPPRGGSPVTLVSLAEVRAAAAAVSPSGATPAAGPPVVADAVEVTRLRGEVALAELRGALEAERARADALAVERARLVAELERHRDDVAGLRGDVDAWRSRAREVEAELRELRARGGSAVRRLAGALFGGR